MERTKRPSIVSSWLSRDEYRAVTAAARSNGNSLAAFLRRAAVARARTVIRQQAARTRTSVTDRVVQSVLRRKEA